MGMVLAMPIHHPRHPEVVLLKTGAPLDSHSIPRLHELSVQEVWIAYPGLEDLVRFVDPQVLSSYRDLTTTIGVALDTAMVQSHMDVDFYIYKKAVMSMLDQLMDKPAAAIFVTELIGGDRPYIRHAGNVCVLSLLMGIKLEFYLVRERAKLSTNAARDISGLGVGAMFHDLGMSRLDPLTLARWNKTHDQSDPAWQQHVTIGYELVKNEIDPAAAGVVLHHHQRYDGSGFPPRSALNGTITNLRGSDIHIFARIVACADIYDRLRHPADAPGADARECPSIPAISALSRLRQDPYCRWIDPVVFRALLAVAPPYPPGSMVTLTGNRPAVVVNWTPDDPCRPEVELMTGRPNQKSRPERIDLRKNREFEVIAIDGVSIEGDNFYPRYEGEFDLARIGKALTNAAVKVGPLSPEPSTAPPVF
jgi:HD-GYP domain-containing protein (c-di-GMP phosphodiesterase class II)